MFKCLHCSNIPFVLSQARLEREREERKLAEAQMRSQMEARLEAQAKQMQDLITFMASQGMQVPAALMAPPPPSQNTDATPVSIDSSVFCFCICLSDIDI
jgi:hypothetical protein